MPNTVGVNHLSVGKEDSNGVTVAFPDVCKTPSPGGPIPIPYPNIAKSSDTAKGGKKVSADGKPLCLESSNFSTSRTRIKAALSADHRGREGHAKEWPESIP